MPCIANVGTSAPDRQPFALLKPLNLNAMSTCWVSEKRLVHP